MSKDTKMVIVSRTHFSDGKGGTYQPRKGKLIAQACHSVEGLLTNLFDAYQTWEGLKECKAFYEWNNDGRAKISLGVKTEEELLEIYRKASAAKINTFLVQDSGVTEFKNISTYTVVGLGPDYSDKIDHITGHLSLL